MKRNKNNRKNFKIKKNNFQSRLTKQNVLNVGPCQGDPFNIPTNSLQKAISTAIYKAFKHWDCQLLTRTIVVYFDQQTGAGQNNFLSVETSIFFHLKWKK